MNAVHLKGLAKAYGDRTVLRLDELALPQGEFFVLVGPSGSGKSTLLGLMAGLDRPTSGSIELDGSDITTMAESRMARFRREKVGYIFQSFHLIPTLTAMENVAVPLELSGEHRADERAADLLAAVGLVDRMKHYPRQLSGGQEQRVAIARAIVTDPTFLLCDEPTGDLDRKAAAEILDLITELESDHGKTILMVTHDPLAAERADMILHLDKGALVEAAEKAAAS